MRFSTRSSPMSSTEPASTNPVDGDPALVAHSSTIRLAPAPCGGLGERADDPQDRREVLDRIRQRRRRELGDARPRERPALDQRPDAPDERVDPQAERLGEADAHHVGGVEHVEIDVQVHGGRAGRLDRVDDRLRRRLRQRRDGDRVEVRGLAGIGRAHAREHEPLGPQGSGWHEPRRPVAEQRAHHHAVERLRVARLDRVDVGVRVEPHHRDLARSRRRPVPRTCPMAPSSTLQSPPIVIAGPSMVDSAWASRSRTSSIELARCTPVPWSSPASSGTSTTCVLADGRSPRMASAPSTSRIALVELEPCHCGTTTNVTATRPVWPSVIGGLAPCGCGSEIRSLEP